MSTAWTGTDQDWQAHVRRTLHARGEFVAHVVPRATEADREPLEEMGWEHLTPTEVLGLVKRGEGHLDRLRFWWVALALMLILNVTVLALGLWLIRSTAVGLLAG